MKKDCPRCSNEADLSACVTDADGDGYGEMVPATGIDSGTDCDDADTDL